MGGARPVPRRWHGCLPGVGLPGARGACAGKACGARRSGGDASMRLVPAREARPGWVGTARWRPIPGDRGPRRRDGPGRRHVPHELRGRRRALSSLQDVAERFGAIDALRGVAFSVDAGGDVALLGDGGAGESTLVEIVSGGLEPTAGRVLLDEPSAALGARRRAEAPQGRDDRPRALAPDLGRAHQPPSRRGPSPSPTASSSCATAGSRAASRPCARAPRRSCARSPARSSAWAPRHRQRGWTHETSATDRDGAPAVAASFAATARRRGRGASAT